MPRSKSGSLNGGVIGKKNKTSFGKNTITTKTSTGSLTTSTRHRFVKTLIVAGGGGGGGPKMLGGGGGGAGGLRNLEIQFLKELL